MTRPITEPRHDGHVRMLDARFDLDDPQTLFAACEGGQLPRLYDQLAREAPLWQLPGVDNVFLACTRALVEEAIAKPEQLSSNLTRVLYFISGIFYVPAMMPEWARDALAWNPLLHAIDWFRAGFFDNYQPHWLDRSYLVTLAILSLLGGLGLERGLRRPYLRTRNAERGTRN